MSWLLTLSIGRAWAANDRTKTARYWSTDPRASMDGHPGRSLPFNRIFDRP